MSIFEGVDSINTTEILYLAVYSSRSTTQSLLQTLALKGTISQVSSPILKYSQSLTEIHCVKPEFALEPVTKSALDLTNLHSLAGTNVDNNITPAS